jgi:hypothetical protein
MKLKRTGKFWLVVAGPLALPMAAAFVVLALSTAGEHAARSQAVPARATASGRASSASGPARPPDRAVARDHARLAKDGARVN